MSDLYIVKQKSKKLENTWVTDAMGGCFYGFYETREEAIFAGFGIFFRKNRAKNMGYITIAKRKGWNEIDEKTIESLTMSRKEYYSEVRRCLSQNT